MLYNITSLDSHNLISIVNSEKYSRGRRGAPAKGVGRETGARVRIPLSPLEKDYAETFIYKASAIFLFFVIGFYFLLQKNTS